MQLRSRTGIRRYGAQLWCDLSHRFLKSRFCIGHIAGALLGQADRRYYPSIVRKPFLRELERSECTAEITQPVEAIIAQREMSLRQVGIERDGAIGGVLGCCQSRRS